MYVFGKRKIELLFLHVKIKRKTDNTDIFFRSIFRGGEEVRGEFINGEKEREDYVAESDRLDF